MYLKLHTLSSTHILARERDCVNLARTIICVVKFRELQVLLHTKLTNIDIVCFTEHWLNHQTLHTINFDNFSLSSEFCRRNDKGGSCIYIKKE
jgi:hypothetical protein